MLNKLKSGNSGLGCALNYPHISLDLKFLNDLASWGIHTVTTTTTTTPPTQSTLLRNTLKEDLLNK